MVGLLKATPTSPELTAGQVRLDAGGVAAATVTLAFDVLPVPPLVEVTVTELFCGPVVVPVTFMEKVQLAPPASAAPERLTDADLATAVMVPPPQAPVSPFGDATINPAGKLSVKATPVRVDDAFGFVMVKLRLVLPFSAMEVGLNALPMVGEARVAVTVRVAVLLAEPAVGVCVVVTPEVVLGLPPRLLLVTLNVTVQLPLAGMVIPVKLRAVAPPLRVPGVVPTQVPPTAPPTALMLTSVSANAPPVSADALLLDKVRVTVELPPDTIEVGLNALLMVGEARAVTVRVAVLLAAPAVGVCVVVTPEVVLGLPPRLLLVTLNVTVQLPLAGMVIPVKLRAVAPPLRVPGVVPTQVPPTAPPTA